MIAIEPIRLSQLTPSRWQPRQPQFDAVELLSLAESIAQQGLYNPILVFPVDDHYELIAGERRSRAMVALALAICYPQHKLEDWVGRLATVGLAGMGDEERAALDRGNPATIPAKIYPADDMIALHLIAVTENLDRAALSPIEEAYAYKGLLDAYGWSQRELAGHINKSQGYVAQRLVLLNLNEQATNALNTRVISMSHARAIAAVPEALQQAATDYVVHAVVKEDSPATTRQVENQMRALAAFMDPARWEPNGEHAYKPQQRNRLAVIQMLMGMPQTAEHVGQNLDALMQFKDSYETKNLLTAKPLTIVDFKNYYLAVVKALGMQPGEAWDTHCLQAGKTCDSCAFNAATPHVVAPGVTPFCARWHDGSTRVCENWISDAFGPIVINNDDYEINDKLRKAQAYESEPFSYTTHVEAYIAAYEAVVAEHLARDAQRKQEKVDGPRRDIAEFYAWQKTLPREWLEHSQAHHCGICRHHYPLNSDAPCQFAINPVKDRSDWVGPRAPRHGMLVNGTLMTLPRCEMFTLKREHTFRIFQHPGFSIHPKDRKNFMNWMRAAKSGHSIVYGASFSGRGPFSWVCTDEKNYDWDSISNYLYKHWEEIGDGGMVTLLDALIYEVKLFDRYQNPVDLIDMRFGAAETWMLVAFADRDKALHDWPQGWLKPWEAK